MVRSYLGGYLEESRFGIIILGCRESLFFLFLVLVGIRG